jgi:hypothetical protein
MNLLQTVILGIIIFVINPLDKVVELYERLVQADKDKNEYLEKLLKEK